MRLARAFAPLPLRRRTHLRPSHQLTTIAGAWLDIERPCTNRLGTTRLRDFREWADGIEVIVRWLVSTTVCSVEDGARSQKKKRKETRKLAKESEGRLRELTRARLGHRRESRRPGRGIDRGVAGQAPESEPSCRGAASVASEPAETRLFQLNVGGLPGRARQRRTPEPSCITFRRVGDSEGQAADPAALLTNVDITHPAGTARFPLAHAAKTRTHNRH